MARKHNKHSAHNKIHHQHNNSCNHQHSHSRGSSSSQGVSYIPNAQPLHPTDQVGTHSSVENEKLEAIHYYTVLSAFALYEIYSFQNIQIRENYFNSLDLSHKKMLGKNISLRFDLQRTAVSKNYNFIRHLLPDYNEFDDNDDELPRRTVVSIPDDIRQSVRISDDDMEKVHSTIKQFMRDWSNEGAKEREITYGTLLTELISAFPENTTPESRSQIRVLTPGAGLGRLTWEIARLGFASQGNEFSFYMLLGANFLLNDITEKNRFTFYPFAQQSINVMSMDDQLRPANVPDVNPSSLSELLPPNTKADLSMVAGDFVEVYSHPSYEASFDCVVTCFFIDTGKNIFKYVDVIHKILKPGGKWINLGPLLYHYAEMPNTFSIELTFEEVRHVIQHNNRFQITKEKRLDCPYCGNDQSMLQLIYKCVQFTAIKQE